MESTAPYLVYQSDVKHPSYAAIPSDDIEQLRLGQEHLRRRVKRRRFFKFSLITFLVVGVLYFHSSHIKRHCSSRKPHHEVSNPAIADYQSFPELDSEAVIIIDCPSWDSTSSNDEKTFHFELPIEDGTSLFLVNKHNDHHFVGGPRHPRPPRHGSSLPSGSIKYVVDSEGLVSANKVKVDLKATKVDNIISDNVHVCAVEVKGNGPKEHPGKAVGVAIATERGIPHQYEVPFEITVTFPSSASLTDFLSESSDAVKIQSLYSHMPLFSHAFGELAGKVEFGTLAVETVVSDVTAESLFAKTLFVRIAQGAIEGNFSAEGNLHLTTANAPIKANVTLRDSENSDEPAKLIITTANAAIDANVTLKSYSSESAPGSFDVKAETANGPLDVTFLSAPVDSSLFLKAHTAHATAHVKLHETYEGPFHLGTALGKTVVNERNDVKDPKGKKRTRRVYYEQKSAWSTTGSVSWEDEGIRDEEVNGKVDVATVLGDAILDL